jgi:hypothetical protein
VGFVGVPFHHLSLEQSEPFAAFGCGWLNMLFIFNIM